jgi:hypothetical protein
MSYTCKAPILLLFFNRPAQAEAVIQRVRDVKPARLYVHCDGARESVAGESERVQAVRDMVANAVDWPCVVSTLYRAQNMGLRAGVYDALNWFFEAEPFGIVLEDDCLPDLSFFPFCDTMLERYAQEPRVMHIGGFNPGSAFTRKEVGSYFFSQLTFVWGWASWRSSWQKMTLEMPDFELFVQKKRIQQVLPNAMAQAYLMDKFNITRQNKNNSWAYAWHFNVLAHNGLSIVPTKNLVQNTGIGATDATHTSKQDPRAAIQSETLSFPLIHPTELTTHADLDQQLFYLSQKSRSRLILWYLMHQLRG